MSITRYVDDDGDCSGNSPCYATIQEAVDEANAMIRHAEGEATRIRLEAEDYSDRAFEETEAVLDDLLGQVRQARAELHQARRPAPPPDDGF